MPEFQAMALHRITQKGNPAPLTTLEQADSLIDQLLESSGAEGLAQVHSLERTRLPSGYFDHELLVGADGELGVGLLAMANRHGNFVTVGTLDSRADPAYSLAGHRTEIPGHSEIPINLVRKAFKEFLTTGGSRPTCVDWKDMFEPEPEVRPIYGNGLDTLD